MAIAIAVLLQDMLKLDVPQAEPPVSSFMIGPAFGYANVRDADEGSWYLGLMARLKASDVVGFEASVLAYRAEFESESVILTDIPAQLSLVIFPIAENDLARPYVLAGFSVHSLDVEYRRSLKALGDDSDTLVGGHLGAGAELQLGPRLAAILDFRYTVLGEPDLGRLEDAEFDTWQVALGVGFQF